MKRLLHFSMRQRKCLRKRKCVDREVMLASCREMVTHPNSPKYQATAPDRNGTALSGISNSGTTLEPSKKMDGFFYTAKMIVIITEKATL